jgi:glucosamine-6-phosphate deaminase
MTSAELASLMELPVEELRRRARIRFRLAPDIPSLLDDFARSIADEIKSGNSRGAPTRLILPVGPVAQYRTLVDISNRELISWANV